MDTLSACQSESRLFFCIGRVKFVEVDLPHTKAPKMVSVPSGRNAYPIRYSPVLSSHSFRVDLFGLRSAVDCIWIAVFSIPADLRNKTLAPPSTLPPSVLGIRRGSPKNAMPLRFTVQRRQGVFVRLTCFIEAG
jgi:hypothetical protein